MLIHPLHEGTERACLLISEAFAAAVRIEGISAAEIRWLLGHPDSRPFSWPELRERGPIRIALQTASDSAHPVPSPPISMELPDGRVLTRSDSPALLEVLEHHACSGDRFARSLNLALSQQWARAGLMVVHGAGVIVDGMGVLILGPKASGKSTLSAAILRDGGQVVSDDWLLLGLDAEARPRMERLRGFLMLRSSWATATLLGNEDAPQFKALSRRPKYTLAASPEDPRFPSSHAVDRICLLQRPRTRPDRSESGASRPAQSLAALMAASMPVLFSSRFPAEQGRLSRLSAQVLAQSALQWLRCGTDIPSRAVRPGQLFQLNGSPRTHRVDVRAE